MKNPFFVNKGPKEIADILAKINIQNKSKYKGYALFNNGDVPKF